MRGHLGICVLAAVAESLIGNRLVDADMRAPDLEVQHLTCNLALEALERIRQVTLTAGKQTITVVTRRTGVQQQFLAALAVGTRVWTRPVLHD